METVECGGCQKKVDNGIFSKSLRNRTYEKVIERSRMKQKMANQYENKETEIIKIIQDDYTSDETYQLQYILNKEYFEPFHKTPPNDFLIKLYKRLQIYS